MMKSICLLLLSFLSLGSAQIHINTTCPKGSTPLTGLNIDLNQPIRRAGTMGFGNFTVHVMKSDNTDKQQLGNVGKYTINGLVFDIEVTANGKLFRDTLIRVDNTTKNLVNPGPGLIVAPFCDVGAVTNQDRSLKKTARAFVTLEKPGEYTIDVTVVTSNGAGGLTEYFHDFYIVNVQPNGIGESVCAEGFLMDRKSIETGTLSSDPTLKTLEHPGRQTVAALVDDVQSVIDGYELLIDPLPNETTYRRGYGLTLASSQLVAGLERTVGKCKTCFDKGTRVRGVRVGIKATVIKLATATEPALVRVFEAQTLQPNNNKFCGDDGNQTPPTASAPVTPTNPPVTNQPPSASPVNKTNPKAPVSQIPTAPINPRPSIPKRKPPIDDTDKDEDKLTPGGYVRGNLPRRSLRGL